MKKLFIVANWKAHKTITETTEWFDELAKSKEQFVQKDDKHIIICPSFHLLAEAKKIIDEQNLPISLGAQNVAAFDEGAYTGEIAARQLQGLVTYIIIGHSERRLTFAESDEILQKKVQIAKAGGFEVIYCVQGDMTIVPQEIQIVAYEPIAAIGSGHADTPENAEAVAHAIKEKNPHVQAVLYGGSVTDENVHSFTSLSSIDGVLIGGASLDPVTFTAIIINA